MRFADGPLVEVGLLGPFEVRANGRVVAIGPKYRVLLAALALQAGRPVSMRDLAETIWGEVQPANPRRTVQLYVTRLRQAFVDGDRIIRTQAEGYRIDLPPNQIDLVRFEQGLAEAARAADQGDLDAEVAALAEALAQWRGEPLVGVPSEQLHRDIAPRLHELRLQAMEQRFAVELRRGRHAVVIGELSALAARHPLREGLWTHLIVALQESGRRADALVAYNRLRRVLADELGIEPAEALRALHATILAGRPGGPSAMWPPVPRQLPPDSPAFAGREEELVRLSTLLDDRHDDKTVIVVASGTAGVGKTALVSHWARRAADRFADGQLWVDLRGHGPGPALGPEQVLNRFLRALGVSDARIPLELADQIGMYRSLMDGRRMLVVLDNAADAAQVRPLVPGAPGCLVLVTSRNQLANLMIGEGARPLVVDLLSPGEARQLLAARLGADRVDTEPDAVSEIIELCARLPLALAIVAARAATHPEFRFDALAAELRGAQGGLDAFTGPENATGVRMAFASSYHALGAPAALVFRRLGLHPGPDIAAAAVASLVGIPRPQAHRALRELCGAHLLTEHTPGRYAFHDLLRAYAAELATSHDTTGERRVARQRGFDHYLLTVQKAAPLLEAWEPVTTTISPPAGVTTDEIGDHRAALSWCAAEHHVLLAVIQRAADVGFATHTWLLAWTLAEYLYRQGHWHDWALVLQTALEAANRYGTRTDIARAHRELARAYARLGHLDAAGKHGKLALEHAAGDPAGLAYAHRALGVVLEAKGLQHMALEHDHKALELFQAIGHRTGQGRTLNAIGWTCTLIGDHEQALIHCQQALKLQRDLGDRKGQAATLDSLGHAHHHLGHYDQAVLCYEESLDLFRDIGDRYKEAGTLTDIGDTHRSAGNLTAARAAWQQSLRILTELGHHNAGPLQARIRHLDRREAAPLVARLGIGHSRQPRPRPAGTELTESSGS